MANYTMDHLIVGANTYEIVDSVARVEAEAAFATDTASGAVATFPDGADGVPVKSLSVAVEAVQSGSGDPSPTNVRPISGWTAVNVNVTGINVWDEEWELGNISTSTGGNVASSSYIRSKGYISVVPGTTYNLYMPWAQMFFYDRDKVFLSTITNGITEDGTCHNKTFTISDEVYFIRFRCTGSYGTTYGNDISINYPSTDTDYHAYDGTTTPISLGRTVYGGTLNVTTGELTVTHEIVDLGTLNWTYTTGDSYAGSPYFESTVISGIALDSTLICSHYTYKSNGRGYIPNDSVAMWNKTTAKSVAIRDDDYTDADAFKTAMSGVQLVYELATPQTYTLTPTEVDTLLCDNNIWADSGNVSVTYKADTKLYINKVISAL